MDKLKSRKVKFLISMVVSLVFLMFGGVGHMVLFFLLFLSFMLGRLFQNFVIQYKDYKEMNRLGILTYRLKDSERTKKLINELNSKISAYENALNSKESKEGVIND